MDVDRVFDRQFVQPERVGDRRELRGRRLGDTEPDEPAALPTDVGRLLKRQLPREPALQVFDQHPLARLLALELELAALTRTRSRYAL